jgi:hypothetical protein
MRHRFLLAGIALLMNVPAWSAGLVPDLQHLDSLPMHALPLQIVSSKVQAATSKVQPYQFAVSAALPLGLGDGVWQQLDGGIWSWRTRVYSANAQTLNFHFDQFRLPPDGALWIYDAQGRQIDGPYTESSATPDGQLWTAVVPGETAVLELRVPAAEKSLTQLHLAEVNHGFRGFSGKAGTGSFGDAGSCETDVACPAGQPWLNEARALARISINGNTLCSGQLINDIPQDNTPYFLTAFHCGVTSSTAGSVVFYWNYQNASCGGNGQEPSFQTQSGATFVAGDQGSDFTLVKTAQLPSPSFHLYQSGFDASTSTPQSGAVVHHPEGDVTKISTYSTPAKTSTTSLCEGSIVAGLCLGSSHTITTWDITYSQGITEPGSSGSALYNQNHRIVGQLSGGNTSCSNSGGDDVYGRTDVAWTANAAASGQLKAWLDPGNTGALGVGGKDLNGAASSSSGNGGGGSSGGSGGGGSFTPLTLAALLLLVLLKHAPDLLRRYQARHY